MSDRDAAPPSAFSANQLPHPSLWTRVRPLFAPHVILALATFALVGTAILQHFDTVDAIEATKRLAVASESAAKDRRQTASAQLIFKIDTMLAEHRHDRI
jgi:hypothetical protein